MILFWTTLLPFILLLPLLQGTNATPTGKKTLLNIDVSEEPGYFIRNVPSVEFPRGVYYAIRVGNRSQYAIGDVFDGRELIIPGDPRNTSRYVLVVPRKDGAKYIRILDRYKGYTGKLKANVLEFLRYPTDLHYTKIQRIPLELDVFYQTPTDVVNAELLVNWEKHDEDVANGKAPMDRPENLETMPTKFTIQERMQDEVVLGVVKYNGYIVENRTDGLLSREVTWEGGVEQPRIIILSRYADNHEIRGEHQFVEELDMFESHMNKKRFNSIQ